MYNDIMERWDYWRKQIAEGDRSSSPRDWFESVIEERFEAGQKEGLVWTKELPNVNALYFIKCSEWCYERIMQIHQRPFQKVPHVYRLNGLHLGTVTMFVKRYSDTLWAGPIFEPTGG